MRRVADPKITVFGDSRGFQPVRAFLAGRNLKYRFCGAVATRRIYRPDSLWQIRLAGRLGGLGNSVLRVIRDADAVFDLTGGDSFTDLYGNRRFRWVTAEKTIALEQRRPLILPPQTIGPFLSPRSKRIAQQILKSAAMIWTRDPMSFNLLREMLGNSFNPDAHRCGVDLAFGLDTQEPQVPLPEKIASWLSDDTSRPLVGFNISGLLVNDAAASKRRFHLRGDYRIIVTRFLDRVLRNTDANILLVPHVITNPGHFEHDPDACAAVAEALREVAGDRIATVPNGFGPCEMKWIISHTDWACGTRMHAAIAALSSGVPCAGIAYSPKMSGVFDTCGQGEHVADPRQADNDSVIEQLWRSFCERDETRENLLRCLPAIRSQVETQMNAIVKCCVAPRQDHTALRRAA